MTVATRTHPGGLWTVGPINNLWITTDQINAATGRIVVTPAGSVFVTDDTDHSGVGSGFTSLAGVFYTLPY